MEISETVKLSRIDEDNLNEMNYLQNYLQEKMINMPTWIVEIFSGLKEHINLVWRLVGKIRNGNGAYRDYYLLRHLIAEIFDKMHKIKEKVKIELESFYNDDPVR